MSDPEQGQAAPVVDPSSTAAAAPEAAAAATDGAVDTSSSAPVPAKVEEVTKTEPTPAAPAAPAQDNVKAEPVATPQVDVELGPNTNSVDVPYHVLPVEKVAGYLNTDVDKGLTQSEAAMRLERDGPNALTEKVKRTIWERIWDQINNVLVFILIIVAIISAIKGATSEGEDAITSWIEVVLIIGVVVLNTWIGIRQEGSAEKSAEALKAMLSANAKVVRDGVLKEVPSEDVVIGDVISIDLGEKIPADLRLFKVANFATGEAALTGEALPIEKVTNIMENEKCPLGDRKNLAFSATVVQQGSAKGIVVRTGDDTEIGQINAMVAKVEKKKTNVLVQIDMVSRWIAVFVCITAIVTFLVAYLVTGQKPLTAVSTALVTAVAMIPEGLAAIVTLTYAAAVSLMAKQNAIVRVLPAVETLGSVTVICSDKTGTLTQNIMSMVAFVTSNGRFKVDENAKERVPANFVRNNSFMLGKNSDAGPVSGGAEGGIPNGSSPDVNFLRSMLSTGVLCAKAELGTNGGREGEIGNPTEISIIRAAYFGGVDHKAMREAQPVLAEVPFSSEYKFMASVHDAIQEVDGHSGDLTVHIKGAVDRLIPLCKDQAVGGAISPDAVEPVNADYWLQQAEAMSGYGLRVLCLCRASLPAGSVEKDQALGPEFVRDREPFMTVVGLACILDPPRPECVQSIKEAHTAHVRVAMITGDHKATALAIGEMLGIVSKEYPNAVTGPELDAMDDQELRVAVMQNNVFARASPENKIRIVKALQAEKQVCSMTGDGVNDAPALKAADMGVAMGKEGTDVAREAAEMILADDNFATIVSAVRQGRVVWDNLRKVLLFNTPVNNAQGMSVLFGMIFGLPYAPLTPIQVLYCNLICAVTLGMVLAIEPAEAGIMNQPPRRVGKRLIGRYLLFRIAFGTVVLVGFTVGMVFVVRSWGIDEDLELKTADGCNPDDVQEIDQEIAGYNVRDEVCCPFTILYNTVDDTVVCPDDDGRNLVRSQASNTLTVSAIAIMLSARFSYNSGFSMELFRGNKWAWFSAGLTLVLQICITYIPGLNNLVFSMGPMTGDQWGLVAIAFFGTFTLMETEKAIMRTLKSRGADTDDNDPKDQMFVAADGPVEPFVDESSQRSATLHQTLLHK
eukprot:CAMPEP_0184514712 /NCGR_PEP_ID=MMETSP0198_2-20121128/4110_1 /TAXON_ID=1112570 /ORGANISM="Thraustochytrium sp., Strain LLF1b" /LENGTH=1132 /DNA_ID=CAMNT_0026904921 /DNA_START=64 /DNA_END=3462 /DNA_ORIENTATION=-